MSLSLTPLVPFDLGTVIIGPGWDRDAISGSGSASMHARTVTVDSVEKPLRD